MFDEALKIARRSTHRRYLTGALIFNRHGDILSKGWSHTGFKMYNMLSVHAEMHCLWRARHLDLTGCSIFVITVAGKSGNITTAKPCCNCAVALKLAGINEIYYSVPGGDIAQLTEIEELKDYSVENNYGKSSFQPPDWAIPKRKRKVA